MECVRWRRFRLLHRSWPASCGRFPASRVEGIFVALNRRSECSDTSCDDELNSHGICVEGRGTLGGVESGDTAAGSGAHVDKASTTPQSGSDEIDRAGDLRQSALHGGGDFGVFRVDYASNLKRAFQVEIPGS